MTGWKKEKMDLQIKFISSASPITERKETFTLPLCNGQEGFRHMKSMIPELTLPLPWRALNQFSVWKRREMFS